MKTQCQRICVTFIGVLLLYACPWAHGQGLPRSTNENRLLEARQAVLDTEYDRAIALFRVAHLVADSLHFPDQSAEAWLGEANCRLDHPDPPANLAEFVDVLDSATALADTPMDQFRLSCVAVRLHVENRNLHAALNAFKRMQQLRRRLGGFSNLDKALCAFAEGEYHTFVSEHSEAVAAFQACIAALKGEPQRKGMLSMAYREVAFAYHGLHDFDLAIASARKAIILSEESYGPNHHQTARAYTRLGHIQVVIEHNVEALENYLRASKICRKIYGNDHPKTLRTYNGLANVYHNLGDSARATQYYLRTLHSCWATEPDSCRGAGVAYRNLGIHYFDAKNYRLARYYWTLANKVTAYTFGQAGEDYLEQLVWIGETWSEEGDHRKANAVYNVALKLIAPEADTSDAYALTSIVVNNERKRLLALIANEKGQNFLSQHLAEGGMKSLQASLACLEYGLSSLDSIRAGFHGNDAQVQLMDYSYHYYELAIEASRRMHLASNDINWLERAFGYMERSKSTLLNSAIRTASLGTVNSGAAIWKEQESILSNRIDELEYRLNLSIAENTPESKATARRIKDELLQAEENLQYYLGDLETCDPGYFHARYGTKGPSFKEVRARMGAGPGAFIEYFVGQQNYYILVITGQHAHLVQRPLKGLDGAVEGFLAQFNPTQVHKVGAKGEYLTSAQLLYSFLIDPVAGKLPSTGRLVIAPDGKLGHVPFEALVRSGEAVQPDALYANFPFLIRDYVIGYASSASAMLHAQPNERKSGDLKMLAIAPSFEQQPLYADAGRSSLASLKHAPQEVKQIAHYIKGNVVSGTAATEEHFKNAMAGYNILHFATHGTIADENPLWSGIEFTKGQGGVEDGTLHTMELFGMKLDADMAVLSACNTGRGKMVRGEGIMSLARGFMYAGCPSIVMSLYAVDDAATSLIMDGFYKSLSKGNDKDASLKLAKEDYLRSNKDEKCHPYYWAAHVLIGAPEGFKTQGQGMTWVLVLGGMLFIILLDELRKR